MRSRDTPRLVLLQWDTLPPALRRWACRPATWAGCQGHHWRSRLEHHPLCRLLASRAPPPGSCLARQRWHRQALLRRASCLVRPRVQRPSRQRAQLEKLLARVVERQSSFHWTCQGVIRLGQHAPATRVGCTARRGHPKGTCLLQPLKMVRRNSGMPRMHFARPRCPDTVALLFASLGHLLGTGWLQAVQMGWCCFGTFPASARRDVQVMPGRFAAQLGHLTEIGWPLAHWMALPGSGTRQPAVVFPLSAPTVATCIALPGPQVEIALQPAQ
mmetsp:Transcript_14559/g.37016  ORF Transcript_14559/g.37016 Transcript_14559/m.37016 type:complete len:272 (+) Transcript_14559:271-1086(+)